MSFKKNFVLYSSFFFFSSAFLELEAAIKKGAKYKRKRLNTEIYLSPGALGRGNTYITTARGGPDALFFNPALLPMPKEGIYDRTYLLDPTMIASIGIFDTIAEVSSLADLLKGESFETNEQIANTYNKINALLKKWEAEPVSGFSSFFFGSFFKYVGFGVLVSGTVDLDSDFPNINSESKSLMINGLVNIAPAIGFYYPILQDELIVGMSVKYLFRFEVDFDQSKSITDSIEMKEPENRPELENLITFDHKPAFDLALVYKPKISLNPRFGLVFANMGNVNFKDKKGWASYEMEAIRQNLGFGMSIHPELGPGVLSVSLDLRDLTQSYDTSFLSEVYLGFDYLIKEKFGISLGLSQGYPTGALYFTSHNFQANLGFYTKERGLRIGDRPDGRFFFKLSFAI